MTTKTTTQVETQERVLTPEEEKVVRMRRGLRAPDDLELEFLDDAHPEIADTLRAMEERALAAVGPRSNDSKRKIVKALRAARKH
ncbi:MAG: hypothetical protein AAFQ82_20995 [Myxococcota bacterium]